MRKKIFIVAAVLAVSQVQAQNSNKTMDTVIVTANKFPQKQDQTGKVITVITKEEIEKNTGKTIAQVLNEQAGINIVGSLQAQGSVQTLFMRGANAGRALILLDGIPMNDPSTITTDYDLNLFSINDVERIEICKGAQSTLYGSDAIGGVVNIITVKNNVDKAFNGKATLGFGNKSTTRSNIQLYGKTGDFTYTTRFAKLVTSGFSSAFDSAGNKNFDEDGYNGDVINASVKYQATPKLSFKTFIQNSQYKADVDASGFVDKRDYFIKNKGLNTGVGFNYKNDAIGVTGNYQYGEMARVYDDNASKPGSENFVLNDYNAKSQYVELYTNVTLKKGFSFLAGGDYRFGSMNNSYTSMSIFGPYNSSFSDTSVNQLSGYASVYFNSKHFNVEAGGRYNDHSRYGTNSTFTFNPSYTINDHFRVFGSIATGFKAPSLYQLYADFGTGNPDLKAEKSDNYEIGVEAKTNKLRNRLVGFYRNIKNGIDYDYVKYSYFNFIKQKVKGLEYELSVQPVSKLNITANYTLLISDETTQSRETTADTIYRYLLRRPKHTVNATIGYQCTLAFYVNISGKYVSKRFDLGGYQKADVSLDGYFIVNAYAEYTVKDNAKFFLNAQNITDKKFYDISGYNSIPFLLSGGVTFGF